MPTGYSRSQIVLHWLTALVILWQFVANDAMGAAWRAVRQGNTPAFDPLVLAHVAGGVFVLAFLTFFGVPFISTAPHKGAV